MRRAKGAYGMIRDNAERGENRRQGDDNPESGAPRIGEGKQRGFACRDKKEERRHWDGSLRCALCASVTNVRALPVVLASHSPESLKGWIPLDRVVPKSHGKHKKRRKAHDWRAPQRGRSVGKHKKASQRAERDRSLERKAKQPRPSEGRACVGRSNMQLEGGAGREGC